MTILLTGGTGKTGSELAKALHAANLPLLIASRRGKAPAPFKAVTFDWLDPTTFEYPFDADPNIDRVYIVGPAGVLDQLTHVRPFIDLAREKGVERFVLLSASLLGPNNPPVGPAAVHQYLIDSGVDYAVLRPTWFQQNFGTIFATSIRDGNQIFTAMGDGRIPFVSTEDVAQIALEALTTEPSFNKDVLISGPELLTNNEVAKLLSSILGREITHQKLSIRELEKFYVGYGIPEDYAKVYVNMEGNAAEGSEEKMFSLAKKHIGKHSLQEYIRANYEVWMKQ